MKQLIFIFAVMFSLANTSVFAVWRYSASGATPQYAWRAGADSSGQPFYLCRAHYQGSLTPGNIRPGFGGCHISYDGDEKNINHYQVFLLTHSSYGYWQWVKYNLPAHSWRVGDDTNGQPLYVCRARYADGLVIGKTWRGLNACYIPYGGREGSVRDYQVFLLR